MPAVSALRATGGAERPLTSETLRIREVWADNLEEEMAIINEVVEEFNYLAMDTEFPGVVRSPTAAPREPAFGCAPQVRPRLRSTSQPAAALLAWRGVACAARSSVGLHVPGLSVPPCARQVARPVGTYKTPGEYQYQMLRCNVDMLKLIQARAPLRCARTPTHAGLAAWADVLRRQRRAAAYR